MSQVTAPPSTTVIYVRIWTVILISTTIHFTILLFQLHKECQETTALLHLMTDAKPRVIRVLGESVSYHRLVKAENVS